MQNKNSPRFEKPLSDVKIMAGTFLNKELPNYTDPDGDQV